MKSPQGEEIRMLLTGGHAASTAVAVIEEIKKRNQNWKLFWAGRKWATEDKKSTTLEYSTLPDLGVKFINLESGKIQTKFTRYTIPAILQIPAGFLQALKIIISVRPTVVLSFGGASGALISFWAWVFRIPVIIHEQTAAAGRANIFSSRFAKKVAISRESSEKYFPKSKVVVTGNPLRQSVLNIKSDKHPTPKTILITGGSRGSERINKAVSEILPTLLEKYTVLHQAGDANAEKYKLKNPKYKVYGQVGIDDMPDLLSRADIIVARAGANTVSELIVLKKPSVLIPIPWSYLNEQTQNAKYAESLGFAVVLEQDRLSGESLLKEIEYISKNYTEIVKRISKVVSPDIKASQNLVDILTAFV